MKNKIIAAASVLSFLLMFFSVTKFITTNEFEQYSGEYRERERGRSGAMEALDFWSRSRSYPGIDIPQDRYFKEYVKEKNSNKQQHRLINAAGIWEPMGPLDLQGRSLSVAVNPKNSNTIYVGSASGGLWRSFTMGMEPDWLQVPLGYPALGISSILIDPVDTNTMYLGTGEVYRYQGSYGGITVRTTRGSYGIGILKSTNGGVTWSKSLDWSINQQRGIQKLLFNPLNRNTIWAATTEGLYVSRNKGETWQEIFSAILVQDVLVNSNDTNKIIISVGNFKTPGYGLYLTTNGGTDWGILSERFPDYSGKTALSMYEANPEIIYASVADDTTGVGGLWRSTDFGLNWTQINTGGIFGVQGWYSHFIAVHPTNPDLLCHASVAIIYSDDGGSNFNGSSGGYSDNHGYAIDPSHPEVLYTANDDGVYRSTDFGKSFTDVGFGMMTGQFYNGFSCSRQDSNIAIGQSQDHIPGYIYKGSLNWESSVVDETGWTVIHPTDDNIMYADSRYGENIYISTDRGTSFFQLAGLDGFGSWDTPLAISTSNPSVLYFAKDKVYKSTDAGTSWAGTNANTVLDGNPPVSIAMSETSPDTLYIGNAPIFSRARLWRTANGGTSWTDITSTLPDRYPLDLAVDPNNSRIVYVVFGGFGSGKIYKSTNSGIDWTNITGTLPDVPTTAIAIDPLQTNNIYLGNDLGVYLSTDAGSTWSSYSDGLPDAVIVADLVISPSNRALRCVTHGNGVFDRKLYDGTAPLAFDYKALALVSPVQDANVILGTNLFPVKATFRSNSGVDQPDSFDVKIRIMYQSIEQFSTVQKISGMTVGETRLVAFPGSYFMPDTGIYEIQLISLAGDLNPSNDTLKVGIEVTTNPTIAYFDIQKITQAYAEITGGSPGPTGDDAQLSFGLPFSFNYDGFDYDSVQISTNGWLELGSGATGSIRGLSSSGQLGFYYVSNDNLGNKDRPTKIIAPWWFDMASGETSAQKNITYKTIGSEPNRVVVVQWKNVKSYYDNAITARINFQIRLYETSNQIDICYGPVTGGTSVSGAAMGIKDHRGGDYHYFDLYEMKTGTASEVNRSLDPLTNWPGANSCFRINQSVANILVSIKEKWNLISVPLQVFNYQPASVYPSVISGTTFEFTSDAGYSMVNSLQLGKGYWSKFPTELNLRLVGSSLPTATLNLTPGWNIIGSLDHTIPVPTDTVFESVFFGFDNGYSVASNLEPGKGYWVKAKQADTVILGATQKQISPAEIVQQSAFLTISDAEKYSQKLYLTGKFDNRLDMDMFEMPPTSPSGVFDVRFPSNRMLETIKNNSESIFTLRIASATYPVTISYQPKMEKISVSIIIDKKEIALSEGRQVQIPDANAKVSVKVTGHTELPEKFTLEQNYPNPFNPATVIQYSLPSDVYVTLKIFDILGREVAVLVDGQQEAGLKNIEWDATNLPTGMYLYRIQAGDFTQVRKMLLVK